MVYSLLNNVLNSGKQYQYIFEEYSSYDSFQLTIVYDSELILWPPLISHLE